MKDFSTILLIKVLLATVEHVESSPTIDQNLPGTKELKRTLMEQIVKLNKSCELSI